MFRRPFISILTGQHSIIASKFMTCQDWTFKKSINHSFNWNFPIWICKHFCMPSLSDTSYRHTNAFIHNQPKFNKEVDPFSWIIYSNNGKLIAWEIRQAFVARVMWKWLSNAMSQKFTQEFSWSHIFYSSSPKECLVIVFFLKIFFSTYM